jgi:hypothetical protein
MHNRTTSNHGTGDGNKELITAKAHNERPVYGSNDKACGIKAIQVNAMTFGEYTRGDYYLPFSLHKAKPITHTYLLTDGHSNKSEFLLSDFFYPCV